MVADKYKTEYAPKFLEAMKGTSVPTDDPDTNVWTGSTTKYVDEIFPPPPKVQAGRVTGLLQKSGCITLDAQGGGPGGHAIWLVHMDKEYDPERVDPFAGSSKEETVQQRLNGINNRLHNMEKFLPMLLEIATERAGMPSPAEQIAAAFDEAATSGSNIKDQLQSLLPDEVDAIMEYDEITDQNSTQEDS